MTAPVTSLTAAGLCHGIPVGGHPAASEVTVVDGVAVSHLVIGYLETGQPVTVDSPSPEFVADLISALLVEQAMFAMYVQDHAIHPFADEAGQS